MKTKKTPKTPYCAECGGTNVTTTAWVEWRADGTERPTNDEGPISGDEGNWCADCDAHVEIVYPPSMLTVAASRRHARNTAAREHGPALLKLLAEVLAAVGEGSIDGDESVLNRAEEYIERLTR
jgi:hypothetical protein